MKSNLIIPLLYIAISLEFAGCKSPTAQKLAVGNEDSTAQNKHKWLKQYALCSCVKFGFKYDDSIKNDLSFTVLKGISDYGNPIVYDKLDSSANKTAFNIKPSQIADLGGRKAILLSCLNYYESKQLDSLVRSFDNIKAIGRLKAQK